MGPLRVHLGCGRKILPGWVNLDGDTKDEIIERYGIQGQEAEYIRDPSTQLTVGSLASLPFEDQTVDEVLSEGVLEHVGFQDEEKVWTEMVRILKPGGVLNFSVPDFDEQCRLWLKARDAWKGFWVPGVGEGDPRAWFHQGQTSTDEKWGYLLATFFGNQSTEHQYHRNAYTTGKIAAILEKFGFESWEITSEWFKGDQTRDPMLRVVAVR